MRLSDLEYELPAELIAQQPVEPRDSSRLLVVDRARGQLEHRTFRDLRAYLRPGDCLVLNNTRVIPARFFCRRVSGGRIEALFLHAEGGLWHLLLKPSARLREGEYLRCQMAEVGLELVGKGDRGAWVVRPHPNIAALDLLREVGQTPLPPYIHRAQGPDERDVDRYQTVYAADPGAVAAPTAGLHFTPDLLADLGEDGVARAEVTLHVGAGTFAPITVDDLAAHDMHAECYSVSEASLARMRDVRAKGSRLVAVGTTSTRVLESLPDLHTSREGAWTDIFIYPPYAFRHTDALLTNFHLPGSTLIALVMAFAGEKLIREAYDEAVRKRYRFYSYGDAMLIV